ncbi:MAG: hypothetical protein DCF22_08135 [Leptolyngbya sp.]|nr:MAG: hypothetical protein DCF22_08135 [Leptolyngbya sp.]
MMHPAKASAIVPRPEVTHSPSVPISVYREVASELQLTRTSLDSVKVQNDDLVQRNQQLRLEIERVVQSALYLRQLADMNLIAGTPAAEDFSSPIAEMPSTTVTPVQPIQLNQSAAVTTKKTLKQFPSFPGKRFTEQTSQPHLTAQVEAKEIGAWWLVLVICMIIVTAFGTGFLIVRPLLPSR